MVFQKLFCIVKQQRDGQSLIEQSVEAKDCKLQNNKQKPYVNRNQAPLRSFNEIKNLESYLAEDV